MNPYETELRQSPYWEHYTDQYGEEEAPYAWYIDQQRRYLKEVALEERCQEDFDSAWSGADDDSDLSYDHFPEDFRELIDSVKGEGPKRKKQARSEKLLGYLEKWATYEAIARKASVPEKRIYRLRALLLLRLSKVCERKDYRRVDVLFANAISIEGPLSSGLDQYQFGRLCLSRSLLLKDLERYRDAFKILRLGEKHIVFEKNEYLLNGLDEWRRQRKSLLESLIQNSVDSLEKVRFLNKLIKPTEFFNEEERIEKLLEIAECELSIASHYQGDSIGEDHRKAALAAVEKAEELLDKVQQNRERPALKARQVMLSVSITLSNSDDYVLEEMVERLQEALTLAGEGNVELSRKIECLYATLWMKEEEYEEALERCRLIEIKYSVCFKQLSVQLHCYANLQDAENFSICLKRCVGLLEGEALSPIEKAFEHINLALLCFQMNLPKEAAKCASRATALVEESVSQKQRMLFFYMWLNHLMRLSKYSLAISVVENILSLLELRVNLNRESFAKFKEHVSSIEELPLKTRLRMFIQLQSRNPTRETLEGSESLLEEARGNEHRSLLCRIRATRIFSFVTLNDSESVESEFQTLVSESSSLSDQSSCSLCVEAFLDVARFYNSRREFEKTLSAVAAALDRVMYLPISESKELRETILKVREKAIKEMANSVESSSDDEAQQGHLRQVRNKQLIPSSFRDLLLMLEPLADYKFERGELFHLTKLVKRGIEKEEDKLMKAKLLYWRAVIDDPLHLPSVPRFKILYSALEHLSAVPENSTWRIRINELYLEVLKKEEQEVDELGKEDDDDLDDRLARIPELLEHVDRIEELKGSGDFLRELAFDACLKLIDIKNEKRSYMEAKRFRTEANRLREELMKRIVGNYSDWAVELRKKFDLLSKN